MCETNGWRRIVTVRELETLTRRMLLVGSDLYPKVAHGFMFEALVHPLLSTLPDLGRAILADDKVAIEVRGAEFQRCIDGIWSDIVRLYEAAQGAA